MSKSDTMEARGKTMAGEPGTKLVKTETPEQVTHVQPDLVKHLPVAAINRNPRNPRKHFDAAKMNELVASVHERGVLQPILDAKLPAGTLTPELAKAFGVKYSKPVAKKLEDVRSAAPKNIYKTKPAKKGTKANA